jgi:hypothetical protein
MDADEVKRLLGFEEKKKDSSQQDKQDSPQNKSI